MVYHLRRGVKRAVARAADFARTKSRKRKEISPDQYTGASLRQSFRQSLF
jgi:hypothetical protein